MEVSASRLGRVWSAAIKGEDRDKAMRAMEVATLFSLRRAVRNGSVWVDHSLVFPGRARLFFTPERWAAESKRHYTRLDVPTKASTFLTPLLTRVRTSVAAVAKAAREGALRVDGRIQRQHGRSKAFQREKSLCRSRKFHGILRSINCSPASATAELSIAKRGYMLLYQLSQRR